MSNVLSTLSVALAGGAAPVSWPGFLRALLVAVVASAVVAVAGHLVARGMAGRWEPATMLLGGARRPFRAFLLVAAVSAVADSSRPAAAGPGSWGHLEQALYVLLVVTGVWLVTKVLLFVEDLGLRRYRTDVRDNRTARQKRTQVLIIRRLTVGVMVVFALGAVLLSFPAVKALGASVLASAGVASVVAALAAQSILGNVFAGIQLAFNDAIKLDDAVIVEGEWGVIEELTLTYVVVRIWDDRRMVLPSTYFTTTPFQNWTRSSSELLGGVEFDLDWRIDTARMRAELDRILAETDLWDGRAKALQVTDAVGGMVHVRVLVTAVDAGTLFDLRCLVRERMIAWIRGDSPEGLPRQRVQFVDRSSGHGAPVRGADSHGSSTRASAHGASGHGASGHGASGRASGQERTDDARRG